MVLLATQGGERVPSRQTISPPAGPLPQQRRSPQLLPVLHPSSGSWVHPWTGGDWAPQPLQNGSSAEVCARRAVSRIRIEDPDLAIEAV